MAWRDDFDTTFSDIWKGRNLRRLLILWLVSLATLAIYGTTTASLPLPDLSEYLAVSGSTAGLSTCQPLPSLRPRTTARAPLELLRNEPPSDSASVAELIVQAQRLAAQFLSAYRHLYRTIEAVIENQAPQYPFDYSLVPETDSASQDDLCKAIDIAPMRAMTGLVVDGGLDEETGG